MADVRREDVLLGAFAGLEAAHFYSAYLPSLMTIREFTNDEDARRSLRQGEVIATIFALSLGGVVSSIVKSSYPFVVTAIVAGLMLVVYEAKISGKLDAINPQMLGTGMAIATALPFVPP